MDQKRYEKKLKGRARHMRSQGQTKGLRETQGVDNKDMEKFNEKSSKKSTDNTAVYK